MESVVGDSVQQRQAWKVRDDGICDVNCPPDNYSVAVNDSHRCIKCLGSCPKGKNSVYYKGKAALPSRAIRLIVRL